MRDGRHQSPQGLAYFPSTQRPLILATFAKVAGRLRFADSGFEVADMFAAVFDIVLPSAAPAEPNTLAPLALRVGKSTLGSAATGRV
jgi:hypothetical protein